MALLAMCCHSTEANDRLKYTKESIKSLLETVDLTKHRVFIINNASSSETKEFLETLKGAPNFTLIHCDKNIGTARGINLALLLRTENEVCIKTDDDVVWHQSGWVEELEEIIAQNPEIGILGLKRIDVFGEFTQDGNLLFSKDVMGTCTAFSPKLIDAIGYSYQFSQFYGFEDNLYSVRSLAAGFKNAYLPHIQITHLDDGKNPYCEWKKKEAGVYIQEAAIVMDNIRTGKMSYYYDGVE